MSFGIIRQLRKDLPCHWGQQIHSYSPIWASERGLSFYTWFKRLEIASRKNNASMDVEMADDLFHVSFGTIRQLRKDLPCHWDQQIHSYSPIWASERGLSFYSWFKRLEIVSR